MVLSHPKALEAKGFDMACEVSGVAQGLTSVIALVDWSKVEDGKGHHSREVVLLLFSSMRVQRLGTAALISGAGC
jgi:hypothetical protein